GSARALPALLRPFTQTLALGDEDSLQARVQRLVKEPVHGLIGSMEHLARLATCLYDTTNGSRLEEIWPSLTAVLCTRDPAHLGRASLADLLGLQRQASGPLFLEVCPVGESILAVEDPRYGLLR